MSQKRQPRPNCSMSTILPSPLPPLVFAFPPSLSHHNIMLLAVLLPLPIPNLLPILPPSILHPPSIPKSTSESKKQEKLTSVTKPTYPNIAGTTTTYAIVSQAVRGVQRKCFHLLADMSVCFRERSEVIDDGERGWRRNELGNGRTVIFHKRWIHGECCRWVSVWLLTIGTEKKHTAMVMACHSREGGAHGGLLLD